MSNLQPEKTDISQPVYKWFTTTVALITSSSSVWPRPNVMACEWTMNVSWEPLRIMSLIYQGDFTHQLVLSSGEFGVNLCSETQAALANFAGNISGRDCDKLSDPLFAGRLYPATHIKAPMIQGCILNAECVVEQTIELEDYTAVIGRALISRFDPNLKPLLYHQGKFFRLGDRIPKPNV